MPNKELQVAVIIPTHNRRGTVERAVASVLAQTRPAREVIVVDDGSTDGTAEALEQEFGRRIRVLRQEHRGVSAARNVGIAASSAALIGLLDSDDIWLPAKLARQVAFLSEGNWHICQTEESWIRNGKRVNPGFKHAKPSGWILEPSLTMCLISPSCVLFRRSLWQECGPFDVSLPACEDFDLWLRVAGRYPVGLLPNVLVEKYGGHADQLSRRIIGLDLYRIYALKKTVDEAALAPADHRLARTALHDRVRLYAQGCLKRGKPEEAARVWELLGA